MTHEKYEDRIREKRLSAEEHLNRYSPYCDLIYYPSSRDPNLRLAMRVLKPHKPSNILVTTHGWHMSIPPFEYMDQPYGEGNYLLIEVDMRGRAFSDGNPDCNGWELLDVIDAVNFVRKHYQACIINPEVVYFEGGSGGGGNAYAIVGKFPDFFAAATAMCGISDYEMWYENDTIGEFRDELDIWIGFPPRDNPSAYKARSGIDLAENLLTPLFIAHGTTDIRVPVDHARKYINKIQQLGLSEKVSYLELEGVGTREHWGNASSEQLMQIQALSEQNRLSHSMPIEIPDKGSFIVSGYMMTKKFTVILNSLDAVAMVHYDLNKNEFMMTGDCASGYLIQLN
jgi:pimeloyl-ACP methyl ester carboxylesterase